MHGCANMARRFDAAGRTREAREERDLREMKKKVGNSVRKAGGKTANGRRQLTFVDLFAGCGGIYKRT